MARIGACLHLWSGLGFGCGDWLLGASCVMDVLSDTPYLLKVCLKVYKEYYKWQELCQKLMTVPEYWRKFHQHKILIFTLDYWQK